MKLPRYALASSEGRRALSFVLMRAGGRHVAARCGVTLSAVYGWTSGRTQPIDASRQLLEQHFGIPVDAWDRVAERKP